MDDSTTPAKRCSKCGETKPLEAFHRDKRSKDGLTSRCKSCNCARSAAWQAANPAIAKAATARYYQATRATRLAAIAAWRAAHPEQVKEAKARDYQANRAERCAQNRARRAANLDRYEAARAVYRARNREREAARAREWVAANPERAAEQRRAWRRANPDKHLESNRKRRARKLGAPTLTLDAAQWALILDYFNHTCAYCGIAGVALTQDHIVPLSRGGEHSAANVAPACAGCNSRKFDRPLWRFLMDGGCEDSAHR